MKRFFCAFATFSVILLGSSPNFLKLTSAEKLAEYHLYLAGKPHVAGTQENYKVTQYIIQKLRKFGLEVKVYEYEVLLSYPEEIRLFLTSPQKRYLLSKELPIYEDRFSWDNRIIDGYNAFSPSGEVEAEVIFANYGSEEDFKYLKKAGIDVKGKILLIKYGKFFRGGKVLNAQKHGASGVLFYLDPADGGYKKGKTWPEGPFMPAGAIRRGSILQLPWEGDPLTPGYPALPGAKRLNWNKIKERPRIPAVPISYADAETILRLMKGKPAPPEWQGGFPFFYHIDGKVRVKMRVKMKNELRKIYNVIGTLRGEQLPEEWILAGCHYDAWTFGAKDPTGGAILLLEAARLLSTAQKEGFPLKRTIKIAFWDAEEMGIIGSTEWAEQYQKILRKKLIVNINEDGAGGGKNLWASATPRFKYFLKSILKKAKTFEGKSLWEKLKGKYPIKTMTAAGSDHAGTFYLCAIPAASIGASGKFGVYHTAFDNLSFYRRFLDPDYKTNAILSATLAKLLYETANASFVPYDFAALAAFLKKQILQIVDKKEVQQLIPVLDEMETLGKNLIGQIERSVPTDKAARIDPLLLKTNSLLIREEGVFKGSWHKNLIFGRLEWNRYSSTVFPAIVKYKKEKNSIMLRREIQDLTRRLKDINALLRRALEILRE